MIHAGIVNNPNILRQAKGQTGYGSSHILELCAEVKRTELPAHSNVDRSQGTHAECPKPITKIRYCVVQPRDRPWNATMIGWRTHQWLSGVRDGGGSWGWVSKEGTREL